MLYSPPFHLANYTIGPTKYGLKVIYPARYRNPTMFLTQDKSICV